MGVTIAKKSKHLLEVVIVTRTSDDWEDGIWEGSEEGISDG